MALNGGSGEPLGFPDREPYSPANPGITSQLGGGPRKFGGLMDELKVDSG
jgi:hypothetical protein